MKILFVTHYAKSYGANLSMLSLIEGLSQYNVSVEVLLPTEGEFTSRLKEKSISYTIHKFYPWFQYRWASKNVIYQFIRNVEHRVLGLFRIIKNHLALKKIKACIDLASFDCVYTNTSISPFGFLIAKKISVPHIWHLRETAISHLNLLPDFGKQRTGKIIKNSNALIAISKTVAEEFYSAPFPKNMSIIYDGLFWEHQFTVKKNILQKGEELIIAIVGLLSRSKGQSQAIRALSLLKKKGIRAKLLVAGDGDVESLKLLARKLNVTQDIEFLGYVSDSEKVYQKAHIVLMCSTNEGLGRVTLEAMAACRPVVGKASGGTSEIVTDEYNGLLYDGTDEHLADCILKLHKNPELIEKIVNNAFGYVKANFTIEEYTAKVHQLLLMVRKNS